MLLVLLFLFPQSFYYEGILNFLKAFFYIDWDGPVEPVLKSTYVLDCSYWFVYVE